MMEHIHYQLQDQTDVVVHFSPHNDENKFFVTWEGINIGHIWLEGIDQQEHRLIWGASSDLLRLYLAELVERIQCS